MQAWRGTPGSLQESPAGEWESRNVLADVFFVELPTFRHRELPLTPHSCSPRRFRGSCNLPPAAPSPAPRSAAPFSTRQHQRYVKTAPVAPSVCVHKND